MAHTVLEELKALGDTENDWAFLTSKLPFFESLSLARASETVQDPMFDELQVPIGLHVRTCLEATEDTLKNLGSSIMEDVDRLMTKYKPVSDCAETWHMQPVQHLLDPDEHERTQVEVNDLVTSPENLKKIFDSMKGFVSQSSTNEKLKSVIGGRPANSRRQNW